MSFRLSRKKKRSGSRRDLRPIFYEHGGGHGRFFRLRSNLQDEAGVQFLDRPRRREAARAFIRYENLAVSYLTPEINAEPKNENGRDSRYNQQFDGVHRWDPLSLKYITQTTESGEPSSRDAQVRFRLKI